jgi:gliding motility-associated-like protein
VLNGGGTLNAPTNLVTTYQPSASDYAQGFVDFVLESTGNCEPVRDSVRVSFIQSPLVDAGLGNTYCKNNIASIPIAGTLAYAAGASWSGGNGGAFSNSGALSTTYTPSPADITQDSLLLVLTSAGSFFACPNDQDTVVIYFTDAPTVNPGSNLVLCSSETIVNLNGIINGPTSTGIWTTSAAGAFSPSGTQLNAQYFINPLDTLAGSIYLTLESTNNGNCNAVRDSIQITFLGAPTVDITTSDSVCANIGTVNLSGTMTAGYSPTWSTDGAGSIANATLINTVYTVSPIDTTAGSIQIILTTNASICPAQSDTLTLFFADPPRVNAGTDQAFCNNELVQLNGVIQGVTNTGTWTSTGTGSFNPSPNLTTTAYAPSALDVTNGGVNLILTSTNNGGCNPDIDTISIVFIPSPTAAFSNTAACAGSNMPFTDLSTTTVGTINQWLWDFGDFTTSITNNPVHPYAGSGTYNVTLIATSSNGCKDTVVQSVTVNPNPVASFLVDGPCEGAPVTFTDNSFISSGNVIDWTYDFGDGSSVANGQQIVTHVFPGTSTYIVTLEVTSALGCSDTVMIPVSILQRPDANFSATPNPVLALEDVQFTDLSTSPNSVIIGWTWLFGDSTGSNVQNPIQNYANGGDYDVILVVTDANGCTDSARNVQVVTLMPAVPTAFSPNGDGENDVFRVRGGPFKAIDFKVYNNWGQLIFSSQDENVGWDGTFNGEPQPVGVYTWVVDVEITNGRFVNLTGDVTLLR